MANKQRNSPNRQQNEEKKRKTEKLNYRQQSKLHVIELRKTDGCSSVASVESIASTDSELLTAGARTDLPARTACWPTAIMAGAAGLPSLAFDAVRGQSSTTRSANSYWFRQAGFLRCGTDSVERSTKQVES